MSNSTITISLVRWMKFSSWRSKRCSREQFQHLRSPDLIREDIGLALNIAAERVDVQVMIRLLLALVEANARTSAIESWTCRPSCSEAGLADEAIAYCGDDATRVPLAQRTILPRDLGKTTIRLGFGYFDRLSTKGLTIRAGFL